MAIYVYGWPQRRGLVLLDGVLAVLLGLAFYHALIHPHVPIEDFARVFWLRGAVYAAAWVGLLSLHGAYRSPAAWTVAEEARAVVRSTVWLTLLGSLVLLVWVLDADSPRLFLLALFPVQGLTTIGAHLALRRSPGATTVELGARVAAMASRSLHAVRVGVGSRMSSVPPRAGGRASTEDATAQSLALIIQRGGLLRLLDRVLLGQPLPFFVAVGLSLLARWWTIANPLFSGDAYLAVGPEPFPAEFFISQGRWGLVLWGGLRDVLGYAGYEVTSSANLIAVFVFTHAGLLLANVVLRKPTNAEALVFLVIFSLHPFVTEFFFFTEGTVTFALAFWLASVALYACREIVKPIQAIVVGIALLVLATAIYQTAIAQALAVAMLALVARVAILDASQDRTPVATSRQFRLVLAVLASVPIYLLSARMVAWVMGVAGISRSQFSQLMADPLAKLAVMVDSVNLALWPVSGLVSRLDSVVLIGLLAMSALVLVWSVLRAGRWAAAFAIGFLLSIGLLWATGFSALSDSIWLVPRTMAVVVTFSAGLLMLGWRANAWAIWRVFLATGIIVLTVGYIGASNRILYDQLAVNRWDMAQANRILARLEVESGYGDLRALAIIGGRWGYPVPLPSMFGDINVSALAIPWSKLALVEQATGYRFSSPTEDQASTAREYCAAREPWPAAQSVVLQDELGIVCLPNP